MPATCNHNTRIAANGGQAPDNRQEHGRAKAFKEPRVYLTRKTRLARKANSRGGNVDRGPIGADQTCPNDISPLLPGLKAASILADEPGGARNQNPSAIKGTDVGRHNRADKARHIGINRRFQNGRDQGSLRHGCFGIHASSRHRCAAANAADTRRKIFA